MPDLIGVDVGGTFTDVVVAGDGGLAGYKVPTTPDRGEAVASAVDGSEEDVFLHGTTIATNALLEGKGARVVLVTDRGYEDIIEIGRQDRPSLYDSGADRPPPLVDREGRIGLGGPLGELAGAVGAFRPEAVAVGLIESYLDPGREEEAAAAIRSALDIPVLASSRVSPEFREYERLATTVLSAYLTPVVARYLRALDGSLPMRSRLLMTSSGGLIPFGQGPDSAGRLVLSGPAGGAVAAASLGRHHGYEMVFSFDMGGTSTDVCRITGGGLAVGSGHAVAGRVNRVPSVPIRTIGAGGGSIGWADSGGALRVGPGSAGAVPGPAAYGAGGTDPTVTDANLIVGRIPAGLALAGTVSLRDDLARQALARLGDAIGLDVDATAQGILDVVDTHMEHALRSVSVEEGADPRDGVLVAFGGAGGLHAGSLARRLGIGKVLVPPLSGVFSALGLLLAGPRADTARTVMLPEGDDGLTAAAGSLTDQASAEFREVFGTKPASTALTADMRYVGQSHELEVEAVPHWEALSKRFAAAHRQRFGFIRHGEPMEVVNLRATAHGPAPLAWSDLPSIDARGEARPRDGVWRREELAAGQEVGGPALVAETNSVVLLHEGDQMVVLEDGTLEMTTGTGP